MRENLERRAMPTLWVGSIAASAGHTGGVGARALGGRGGEWAMREFEETAAAAAAAAVASGGEGGGVGTEDVGPCLHAPGCSRCAA